MSPSAWALLATRWARWASRLLSYAGRYSAPTPPTHRRCIAHSEHLVHTIRSELDLQWRPIPRYFVSHRTSTLSPQHRSACFDPFLALHSCAQRCEASRSTSSLASPRRPVHLGTEEGTASSFDSAPRSSLLSFPHHRAFRIAIGYSYIFFISSPRLRIRL